MVRVVTAGGVCADIWRGVSQCLLLHHTGPRTVGAKKARAAEERSDKIELS